MTAAAPSEPVLEAGTTVPRLPLLFLCHRIPYPPNKGDKIRALHLLHHLAQHFEVHLATFVDDPADWAFTADVEKHCRSAIFAPLVPWRATLRSARGLLTGEALTLPYYRDSTLARRVEHTVREHAIRHAIVYSSAMAQYLPADVAFERRVVDFVDVDSDKWLQYAARKRWPLSWVYRREGQRLFEHERAVARCFDAGLFVSATEAALFRRLAPEVAHCIGHFDNGVNAAYFAPDADHANPYPAGARVLVFTGAMDYWPNVDAVCWFAREVFPALRRINERLVFYIVGSSPSAEVQALASLAGVSVTGRVPDVRPYLAHALAAVAPLRIARGVQNKVLEAMAMERPVLVTGKGLEGIEALDGRHVLVAENPSDYARHVQALLSGEHAGLGDCARELVRTRFAWEACLPEVVTLLAGGRECHARRSGE
ncbi:TIGR03087 family PEP-CTERM/XrtA system glycosyltransferase [Pseudohaliea sp.]|uniref:TIGR03087 family PEP-CTERM/XrtA system glycosyltransferase n=1 Tax=Pseudohaliea sp. TaxID=2740289 RepID=UPI0032EC95FD